jgi:hypothetical protein
MDNHEKERERDGQEDLTTDEGLIELTDTVNAAAGNADDATLENGEDFIELTDLAEVPPVQARTSAPTDEQVEQALRRVVRELYAEKIERLLFEVVEETVTREIEKIKRLLLDGGTNRTS